MKPVLLFGVKFLVLIYVNFFSDSETKKSMKNHQKCSRLWLGMYKIKSSDNEDVKHSYLIKYYCHEPH